MTKRSEGLTKFASWLVTLRVFRVYGLKGSNKMGGFIWNWWNPLSWILAPLGFFAQGFMEGFPDTWKYKHELGFGINPWYKDKEIDFE